MDNSFLIITHSNINELKFDPNIKILELLVKSDLDENILKNYPNLHKLICTGVNYLIDMNTKPIITNLNALSYCLNLRHLICAFNDQLTNINSLQYCTNLRILNCECCSITDISSLKYCLALEVLFCNDNLIKDLSPLKYCTNLKSLDCARNEITSLEPLVYLRRLNYLNNDTNPLNPPSIQVTRLLERIEENYNTTNSIYNDTQNVHDTQVQQSIMNSVRNLMTDKEVKFDLDSILNSELQANTKSRLLEYFEEDKDEPHVILLITYKELFTYVWNRVIKNSNKLELLKILDDNIQDSECKCFTGRFNRTLSTLVGFYDDIEINISDNSRIGAIILQVKDSIIPYDVTKHKEIAQNALIDAGYDSEIVNIWIEAIE